MAIVEGFAQMWPREVFQLDDSDGNALFWTLEELDGPGIYVLYRDDHPYYIGRAGSERNPNGSVLRRLRDHALNRADAYHLFWNYFSAYRVAPAHLTSIPQIEGLLISVMSLAANRANPPLPRIRPPVWLERSPDRRRRRIAGSA